MTANAPKIIVARDVAEADFVKMAETFRVDLDESELDDEEKEKLAAHRDGIVREIMRGRIIVDEAGLPTYTPRGEGPPVTFHKPTGATLLALETYAGAKNIANTIAATADMTHLDRSVFGRMELRDVQIVMRLTTLFLQDR